MTMHETYCIFFYLKFLLARSHFLNKLVRTRFEFLAQKVDGLRLKKPKTMNL